MEYVSSSFSEMDSFKSCSISKPPAMEKLALKTQAKPPPAFGNLELSDPFVTMNLGIMFASGITVCILLFRLVLGSGKERRR